MNCWKPKLNTLTQMLAPVSVVLVMSMAISSQAVWRHAEGSTTSESILMTERRHKATIRCAGCGREFGIIQQSHIDKCSALHEMGITKRSEYKKQFGNTMSKDALMVSTNTIKERNDSLSPEQRKEQARIGWSHLDSSVFSKAGKAGAKALWSLPNQKENHKKRFLQLLDNALNRIPNKCEEFFLGMIGSDLIEFCSFDVWQKVSGDIPHVHNRMPDFVVKGQNKVIDIFGEKAHHIDEVDSRVNYWKSRGFDCLVVWYQEIKRKTKQQETKNKVLAFISGNRHEREAPGFNRLG